MYDLILAREYEKEMRSDFEDSSWDVKFENAADMIHIGRFGVTFECEDEDEYLMWLFEKGMHQFSFFAQSVKFDKPGHYLAMLSRAVKERDDA